MLTLKQICFFLVIFLFCFSSQANSKRIKCTLDPRLVKCSTERNPVCGFFKKDKCSSRFLQLEAINACFACINNDVLFYEEGPCTSKKVYCDPLYRTEACTKEFNPVCAYSKGKCRGGLCKETAGNKCMACANPDVEFYVRGAC